MVVRSFALSVVTVDCWQPFDVPPSALRPRPGPVRFPSNPGACTVYLAYRAQLSRWVSLAGC